MASLSKYDYATIVALSESPNLSKSMSESVAVELLCRHINALDDLRADRKLSDVEIGALKAASAMIRKHLVSLVRGEE